MTAAIKDIDEEVTPEEVILFKKQLEYEYQREIAAAIMRIESGGKLTYRKLGRLRKSVFFKMFKQITKGYKK